MILSTVLAIPSAFFLSNVYHSGSICFTEVITHSSVCTYFPDHEFLSIGSLLTFLAVIECVMAIQRKKTGSIVWETNGQVMSRRLGIMMLFIGAVLGTGGLFAMNTTMVTCPAIGCSGAELWRIYGAYYVSFYGGACVAAIGAALVLVAAFWRIKPEKWRDQIVLPANA